MDHNRTIRTELPGEDPGDGRLWFCVQTHAKHEHPATGALVKVGGFEVFNPRVRLLRATRRGPVWFTESAFPRYIFARFNLRTDLDIVRYSNSVSRVVHFTSGYPSIPDDQVSELRMLFGEDDIVILTPTVSAGDTVRIVGGAFHDLIAVVQHVLPAKQRVRALLDVLGRMTTVELDLRSVAVEERRQPAPHPLNRMGNSKAEILRPLAG